MCQTATARSGPCAAGEAEACWPAPCQWQTPMNTSPLCPSPPTPCPRWCSERVAQALRVCARDQFVVEAYREDALIDAPIRWVVGGRREVRRRWCVRVQKRVGVHGCGVAVAAGRLVELHGPPAALPETLLKAARPGLWTPAQPPHFCR